MSSIDEGEFRVVINPEAQYSIWPLGRELPAGWSDAGMQGARADCLAHIEEVWLDLRPASVRRMQEGGSSPG